MSIQPNQKTDNRPRLGFAAVLTLAGVWRTPTTTKEKTMKRNHGPYGQIPMLQRIVRFAAASLFAVFYPGVASGSVMSLVPSVTWSLSWLALASKLSLKISTTSSRGPQRVAGPRTLLEEVSQTEARERAWSGHC